jgi:hypothetical protein
MKFGLTAGAFVLIAAALAAAAEIRRAPAAQTATTAQDPAKPKAKSSSSSKRKIPCKTPENAPQCYWTRGRLAVYNGGAPNYRIWKIGTHRILGVFNGPSHFPPKSDEYDMEPEFPASLDKAYVDDNRRHKSATGVMWAFPPEVFADFEVCQLEPEKKGEMQAVCIESAKNIFVDDDDY